MMMAMVNDDNCGSDIQTLTMRISCFFYNCCIQIINFELLACMAFLKIVD